MYNLKIIQSGDRIEIYKINNYVVNESKIDEGHKLIDKLVDELDNIEAAEDDSKEKQSIKDRVRNLTDARNNIIRLIKCNPDMQTFITLTFAEEQDYKESKASLNNFFNKLRRHYPGVKYLWVLEYGELHNRLHYHLLANIPIKIKLSSSNEKKSDQHKKLEQNFQKKYWNHGWVDIRSLKQEDNTNIALYVATYIVKSLEDLDLEGYRVYGYSRKTLNKPLQEKVYTTDNIEDILKKYSEYDIEFSNSYGIGYRDYKGKHIGTVSYFDLIKKGEIIL
ncbi:rolling circle replication-associated protein [Candidatus Clostridium helianthi]|uniref:Replication-associated protein ORF2/G2P domain-containing protein n=1 Tax=Candidatus Clostridium helianthi TaxID=3381660 RepID=A0ABW8S360_9CLOT